MPEMSTEWERTDERALDHVGRSFGNHDDWRIGVTCKTQKVKEREVNQHFSSISPTELTRSWLKNLEDNSEDNSKERLSAAFIFFFLFKKTESFKKSILPKLLIQMKLILFTLLSLNLHFNLVFMEFLIEFCLFKRES